MDERVWVVSDEKEIDGEKVRMKYKSNIWAKLNVDIYKFSHFLF
jgi:hypothetical protein